MVQELAFSGAIEAYRVNDNDVGAACRKLQTDQHSLRPGNQVRVLRRCDARALEDIESVLVRDLLESRDATREAARAKSGHKPGGSWVERTYHDKVPSDALEVRSQPVKEQLDLRRVPRELEM